MLGLAFVAIIISGNDKNYNGKNQQPFLQSYRFIYRHEKSRDWLAADVLFCEFRHKGQTMIVYHPLPSFIHFLKLLLNFFRFPAVMSHNYIYRTLLVLVFSLPTVGNQAKPQTDINYRSSFLESYYDRPNRFSIHRPF